MGSLSITRIVMEQSLNLIYGPLDHERKEIRLLELIPNGGDADAKIHCRMYVASLNENDLIFDALSYTWGTEPADRPIDIDGKATLVTANLEAALRRLNEYYNPNDKDNASATAHKIWIDALCINQKDTPERDSQVSMMRDIYEGAKNVIVWLGEWKAPLSSTGETREWGNSGGPNPNPNESVARAMAALSEIGQGRHACEIDLFANLKEQENQEALSVMRYLLKHPYWHRAWVVQETAAARHAMILCGNATAQFDHFLNLGGLRGTQDMACCEARWHSLSYDLQEAYFSHTPLVWNLKTTRESFHDQGSLKMSLENLLVHFRQRQSTDPLDMVYAFVGLVKRWQDGKGPLEISYALEPAQLYTRVAFRILSQGKNLNLLAHCERRGQVEGLPSWVPDWTSRGYTKEMLDVSSTTLAPLIYKASGEGDAYTFMRPKLFGGSVLLLGGHKVGVVTGSVPPAAHPIETIQRWWTAATEWFEHDEETARVKNAHPEAAEIGDSQSGRGVLPKMKPRWFFWGSDLQDTSLYDCFFRTLLGDFITPLTTSGIPFRRASSEDVALFQHMMRDACIIPSRPNREGSDRFDSGTRPYREQELWISYSRSQSLNKRFFSVAAEDSAPIRKPGGDVTAEPGNSHATAVEPPGRSEGYMGIGPTGMREGDEVWVLFGSPLPFVLRRVEKSVGVLHLDNCLEVVGPCFVNGIMYGETVERANQEGLFLA